jgi:hypothetical protein
MCVCTCTYNIYYIYIHICTHRLAGGVAEEEALVLRFGPAVRVELLLHAHQLGDGDGDFDGGMSE